MRKPIPNSVKIREEKAGLYPSIGTDTWYTVVSSDDLGATLDIAGTRRFVFWSDVETDNKVVGSSEP